MICKQTITGRMQHANSYRTHVNKQTITGRIQNIMPTNNGRMLHDM